MGQVDQCGGNMDRIVLEALRVADVRAHVRNFTPSGHALGAHVQPAAHGRRREPDHLQRDTCTCCHRVRPRHEQRLARRDRDVRSRRSGARRAASTGWRAWSKPTRGASSISGWAATCLMGHDRAGRDHVERLGGGGRRVEAIRLLGDPAGELHEDAALLVLDLRASARGIRLRVQIDDARRASMNSVWPLCDGAVHECRTASLVRTGST